MQYSLLVEVAADVADSHCRWAVTWLRSLVAVADVADSPFQVGSNLVARSLVAVAADVADSHFKWAVNLVAVIGCWRCWLSLLVLCMMLQFGLLIHSEVLLCSSKNFYYNLSNVF